MSLDIAARVSLGALWPDNSGDAPKGNVLLLSAEDGLADTVKPRLTLLEADMSRIYSLGLMVTKGEEAVALSLQQHLSVIERLIIEKEIILLVIDPLLAFTGKADTHKTAEVRSLLSPIAAMAECTKCAVLAVMHPNKNSQEGNPLYRISASLDFAAAARSVMVVAKHPNNPGEQVLATIKCNLSAHPEPMAFSFTDDGHFAWQGTTEVDIFQLMAPVDREDSSAKTEAKDFLRDALADGERLAKDVLAEAKEWAISDKTLRRSVKELEVSVYRVGEEGRKGGGKWMWSLPKDAKDEEEQASDLDGQTPPPILGHLNPLTPKEPPVDTNQGGRIKMANDHLNARASDDAQGLRWPNSGDDHLNRQPVPLSDDHLNEPSPDSDSDTKPDKDIKMANPEACGLAILINEDGDVLSPATQGVFELPQAPLVETEIIEEQKKPAEPAPFWSLYEYVTDAATAEKIVSQVALAPVVGVDTETIRFPKTLSKKSGKDDSPPDLYLDKIRLVQMATASGAWVFDISKVDIALLVPVFTSPGLKVFHNAQFDLAFIHQATGVTPAPVFCTMLASQLLRTRQGDNHSLKTVAKHYLGWDLGKEEQISDWSRDPLSEEQKSYAALDAAVLVPLHEKLRAEVSTKNLEAVLNLECRLLPTAVALWEKGIVLDWDSWVEVHSSRKADMEAAKTALDAAIPGYLTQVQIVDALTEATKRKVRSKQHQTALDKGALIPINWGSGDQRGAILKALGVALPLTKTSKLSTNQATLAARKDKHPLVPLLIAYLAAKSLVEKYGLNWKDHLNQKTGRVHASFWQCGTVTGRFAISNPALHNIPRKGGYRECFRPSPGCVFLILDWSQVEVRIIAEVSGDEALIQIFQSGEDIYSAIATRLLGLTDRPPTDEERQQAKAVVLGLNYGQSAGGLVKYASNTWGIDMSKRQAQEFITKYFTFFPKLKAWQEREKARLNKHGSIETRTALGRLRTITSGSYGGGESGEEVLNSPIQGSGADCLKLAMVLLHETKHELPGGSVVLPVHDELIYEVPIDQVELGKKRLAWAMDQGLREAALKKVPTGVNPDKIVVSDRWIKI
jgi:DNA polymerase I